MSTQSPQPSAKWPTAPIPSNTMSYMWPAAPGQVPQGTAKFYHKAQRGIIADEQQSMNRPGVPQLDPEAYWEWRSAKRLRAAEAIRRSSEFTRAFNLTSWLPNTSMPPEPNPHDLSISKRNWEAAIQTCRQALRTIASMFSHSPRATDSTPPTS